MLHALISSPIGPLDLTIENGALLSLDFDDQPDFDFFTKQPLYSLLANHSTKTKTSSKNNQAILAQTTTELFEYFHKGRTSFTVPVHLTGTDFRRRAWHKLEKIPYGKVKSYGQIAQEVGSPKASRAVGGACGSNPVAIIVPCHRVTGSDGKLTGFGGGLNRKQYLLNLESGQIGLRSPNPTEHTKIPQRRHA